MIFNLRRWLDLSRPVASALALGDRGILMPFVGDEAGASPLLQEVAPDEATVTRIVDDLLWNIELMLDHDCVHGDLSPYNVMLHDHHRLPAGRRPAPQPAWLDATPP